jgi:pyruvate kinase
MTADVATLHENMDILIAGVRREGNVQAEVWKGEIDRAGFADSALNLAHYLALRRLDLRPLQRPLTALGLSSLGRLESRVLPTLVAVRSALSALLGREPDPELSTGEFFAGEARQRSHTHEILGTSATSPPVALLVTCPTEAADDPAFMLALAERGSRPCASTARMTAPITGSA